MSPINRLRLALPLIALPVVAQDPAVLLERGQARRARALLEAAVQNHSGDARATCQLARVCHAFQELDAALKLAEKGVAVNPKSAYCHFVLAEIVGDIAERSNVFKQMGLAKRFKKEIDTAIALDPKNADALWDLMLYYYLAPGILGGDKTKARSTPAQISQADPARGFLAQAWLAQRDKQTGRLESLYRQAVEADPRHYQARMTLANFLAARKDYGPAERHARAALEIDPERADAYDLLAGTYARQKRWEDLDAILAQADKSVPDNRSPYFRAANTLLADASDLSRAERYFRHYLAQEPEAKSPQHAQAHWRLALVLEKQGRKPDAIESLESALRLKPDLDPAKRDLKRLKS
jgi:tetratricopeptide (TPR) repeat protein